ncbi:MAG: hypothetical protein AB7E51_11645 [Pseudodesulfovibrio sp.]|uniref:hypothetical protein n=1 Tax=Pseudodesulfovibrio sp. TaxID=2035812 RepID=UPI003D0E35DA
MGSTVFRALPVRRGDAFLLRTGRGAYLFDGGCLDSALPGMLRERLVGKLRSVVCTSASPERLGGVLDLMDEGYPVGEYWLPESLLDLILAGRGFDGGFPDWLVRCSLPVPAEAAFPIPSTLPPVAGDMPLTGGATLALLCAAACLGELPPAPRPMTPASAFLAVMKQLLDDKSGEGGDRLGGLLLATLDRRRGDAADLAVLCGRMLAAEAEKLPVAGRDPRRDVARGLALAVLAEGLMARDVTIRFFRQTNRLENRFIPLHPLMCLNGLPAPGGKRKVLPASAGTVFRAARALSGAGAGLVFRYGSGRCGALFCSDSTMAFLGRGNVLPVDRPTVISAPQLGGVGNDEAYARIASRDPHRDVWVRSHLSFGRKVSEEFRSLPVKYCLRNCADRTVQEVLLTFSGKGWEKRSGADCSCP